MNKINRTIWIYWHQGWEKAPEVPKKCLSTWISKNPTWEVKSLCSLNLINFIDLEEEILGINNKDINLASLSDIVRICLLKKYGGVWADSTLLCRRPLDKWLVNFTCYDFFAFSKPNVDRLISSWFLMSRNESYIINTLYDQIREYWKNRSFSDDYFWFHHLFNDLYDKDPTYYQLWADTPKVSAKGPHYFIPYTRTFFEIASEERIKSIEQSQAPVFKLTHKYDTNLEKTNTVLEYILNLSK